MKTSLYVAASSVDVTRIQRWASALDRTGLFTLTSGWIDGSEKWAGRDAYLDREQQQDIARAHMSEIARSQMFWLLMPRSLSGGSPTELGIALAFAAHTPGRYSCVTGNGCSRNVFTSIATFRDESDPCGFNYVCRMARELLGLAEVARA